MFVRAPKYSEIDLCCNLVLINWGVEAADRCRQQMIEYFKGGDYAPVFCVLDIGDGVDGPIVGFAAYQPSMKMKGSFDLIWIAVHPHYQGRSAGKVLTEWRINEIKKRGGQMIELVTQKPAFFSKFGFFKLHHLGNDWYLMLKLLTSKVDI